MTDSSFKNRSTPGVYINEPASSPMPSSIVGVATAIPVFVGYTERAVDPESQKPVFMKAIAVSSLAGYHRYFGKGFKSEAAVTAVESQADFEAEISDGATVTTGQFTIRIGARFNLYSAMQLFFANGGGNCFVISVGDYWGKQAARRSHHRLPATNVNKDDLIAGIDVAACTRGPAMLAIPDLCLLTGHADYQDYAAVAVAMVQQAADLQDRVAILDMPGALDAAGWSPDGLAAQAAAFHTALILAQDSSLSYGAAYGPALISAMASEGSVDYSRLHGSNDGIALMNKLLMTQARSLYALKNPDGSYSPTDKFDGLAKHIGAAFPANAGGVPVSPPDRSLNDYLCKALPLLASVEQTLAERLRAVPPSGIMAGLWAATDANRGVWSAPANLSLNEVTGPTVTLPDEDQENYSMPLDGKAINMLRSFSGRGTMVWGARTLDGNSPDYRYIQTRRTLIYIEQSIKSGLEQYVFAPNNAETWTTVVAIVSGFLTQLWQSGGLFGDKAEDAFTVQCGLGSTMTGQDILDGYLIFNVALALVHPAEFIELTFKQTMQGS